MMHRRGTVARTRIARRSRLVDLLVRSRYWLGHAATGSALVARAWAAAGSDLLRGHPEAALLRYGRAVRHVQFARESMLTYEAIERLIRRYPKQLAAYQVVMTRPERFLFFVGYSRSGHSLVAALLDAHPDIVVSHELHALKHIGRGTGRDGLIEAIQHNSQFFKRFGRGYSGYSYDVAGQHQGRSPAPRIIGDKKANGTSRILRRDPAMVDRLRECLAVPFTFVHVVRNPFDNIASRAQRTRTSLEWAARGYFANAKVVDQLSKRWPGAVVDIHLDDLIDEPKGVLTSLLHRLGITDIDDRYLDDCADLVFNDKSRIRREVSWPPELQRSIERGLRDYDFLARYADAPEAAGANAARTAS